MLSNADVSLIRDNFGEKYKIDEIICKRSITPTEKINKTTILLKWYKN